MNLYVWPSYRNSESFEPESLTVITYVKIAEAPVTIHNNVMPWRISGHELPYLEHSLNRCKGMNEIIPYFRKENYGVEYNLTDDELIKLNMLSLNIHRDLVPAINYLMWYDENQYSRATRSVLGNILGLPMCLIWPQIMRYHINQRIKSARFFFSKFNKSDSINESNDTNIRKCLYDSAKRCLTSIEYLLQNPNSADDNGNMYLVSIKPTYVEAVLYGYLWPLLHLNYDDNVLLSHLKQCKCLMNLLSQIHKKYYPNIQLNHDTGNADNNVENKSIWQKTRNYLSRNRSQITNSTLFVTLAVTLMVVYYKKH